MSVTRRATRVAARALGFPPGIGELLPPAMRARLTFSLLGSMALSMLDMLGVLTMLPLMQFITGQDRDSGALGIVYRATGRPDDGTLVVVLSLIIAGAFIAKDVFSLVFRRWQLQFLATQSVDVSTTMLRNYLVGPYHWHLAKNINDKLWLTEYGVSSGFAGGISAALGVLAEIITITLIAGSLFFVSPLIALLAVIYFGLSAFAMQRLLRPRVLRASEEGMAASRRTSSAALQSLAAAKEIKLRGAHQGFVDSYREGRVAGAKAGADQAFLTEIPKYLLEIIFVVGIGLLAGVASTHSDPGTGLVVLGVFVAASSRLLPSIVRLLAGVNGLRAARPPLQTVIRELHDQRMAQVAEDRTVRTEQVPAGDIALRGVEFAYEDQPDTRVLKGIDLDIPHGQSFAFVGSSGSGKSTLVDTILGLHKPTAGHVRVGGVDIRHNMPGWQDQLAVVPQEVVLLDDTLRRNIIFDNEPDQQRLDVALDRAQLLELVSALPNGLDQAVGERGARLSGGQRQRIGIARALYRDPSVLVLDEATSALDNDTERRFTDTIRSLRGSITTIIVAHRLSTVRECDQVVFLSQGQVRTIGTFTEVMQQDAEFRHLVELGSLGPIVTSEDEHEHSV
ncbi:ABC-type bacteriocin/lantibiotic exporter, contains an N-terminal double-glycine peptidase domain [Nocardioides alpinus]|uniref:ABC-type bacteriocin/lantibiotic exporter, contains an N-terminal double-glycine peptidase domain n=1 Tax=Nocardioides alpinus TaxID=748909 RepID=A0A1I0W454_9ACTN|nr:ABC transporter ATP-binding protein/permease [Nocardioides alpinus]PKH37657.1 hypothetical protein CXG46_19725 [Nocardioides alpinus]SFA83118.1 ABC-type bacteriocin/lantibiotic exporter, contains an N-terminal double-glycine peptidase domain [Nocardioides alpinus]